MLTELTPELWIGSWHGDRTLQRMGFKSVVNLCWKITTPMRTHFPLHDSSRNDLEDLERGAALVQGLIDVGKTPVLVHCQGGRSRSTTICAMVLSKQKGMSVVEAVQFIAQKHPIAHPNPALLATLGVID